jgi:hypothetical protein
MPFYKEKLEKNCPSPRFYFKLRLNPGVILKPRCGFGINLIPDLT